MNTWLDGLFQWVAQSGGECLMLENRIPMVSTNQGWQPVPNAAPVPNGLLAQLWLDQDGLPSRQSLESSPYLRFVQELAAGLFRITLFRSGSGLGAHLKRVPGASPALEEFKMPEALQSLSRASSGLVLFTGPRDGGKTLAAKRFCEMVGARPLRALSFSPTGEGRFHPGQMIMHVQSSPEGQSSFDAGLVASDIELAFLGDIVNSADASRCLRAIESGMLTVAVLESLSVTGALERLVGLLPSSENSRARGSLAYNLRAIAGVQSVPVSKGKAFAWELLVNTFQVAPVVRAGDWQKLAGFMRHGNTEGMLLMDDSLEALVQSGLLDRKEAQDRAWDRARFES